MSHLKERTEKNCLNCNAAVQGRFCHVCGQENIETFESAWHLVTHFFKDITHFDGKFFSTLKYLVLKPGFLSMEYFIGRRASYLNPIRMYVFTSAFFFLIFFLQFDPQKRIQVSVNGKSPSEINAMDSATFSNFSKKVTGGKVLNREGFNRYVDSINSLKGIHFTTSKYKSKAEYDSLLAKGIKKHNWIERTLIYKEIEMNEKYKSNQQEIIRSFVSTLVHTFPQMLFISLPLFALLLKLLYIRRKQYFYGSHAIFSIHFYVFVFIAFLSIMGIVKISKLWDSLLFDWLFALIGIGIFVYEYIALKVFYQQGYGKTLLKFILLNILHLFVMAILFIIFTFFSLLKI